MRGITQYATLAITISLLVRIQKCEGRRRSSACRRHDDCKFGALCLGRRGRKRCSCRNSCTGFSSIPVCTDDGGIFYSYCELHHEQCQSQTNLTIQCVGEVNCGEERCGFYDVNVPRHVSKTKSGMDVFEDKSMGKQRLCDDEDMVHCTRVENRYSRIYHGICYKMLPDNEKLQCHCANHWQGERCEKPVHGESKLTGECTHDESIRINNNWTLLIVCACGTVIIVVMMFVQRSPTLFRHGLQSQYGSLRNLHDPKSPTHIAKLVTGNISDGNEALMTARSLPNNDRTPMGSRSRMNSVSSMRSPSASMLYTYPGERLLHKRNSISLAVPNNAAFGCSAESILGRCDERSIPTTPQRFMRSDSMRSQSTNSAYPTVRVQPPLTRRGFSVPESRQKLLQDKSKGVRSIFRLKNPESRDASPKVPRSSSLGKHSQPGRSSPTVPRSSSLAAKGTKKVKKPIRINITKPSIVDDEYEFPDIHTAPLSAVSYTNEPIFELGGPSDEDRNRRNSSDSTATLSGASDACKKLAKKLPHVKQTLKSKMSVLSIIRSRSSVEVSSNGSESSRRIGLSPESSENVITPVSLEIKEEDDDDDVFGSPTKEKSKDI